MEDLLNLSDEELAKLAQELGVSPQDIQQAAMLREPPSSPQAEARQATDRPQGSFWEGFKGQLASPGIAAARALGGEEAEKVAQMHGKHMAEQRQTQRGGFGAAAANLGLGIAAPYMRATTAGGVLGSAALGGALEGAQEYGEGKDALPGIIRGAAGTTLANTALTAGSKLANAGLKKAGASGRWSSPEEEYIYDFAKSKGVDLRPGDLPGHPFLRAGENIHAGPVGLGSLENQAMQLENALFGNGNKILEGLARVDEVISQANRRLWEPVYQVASQGTTGVRPLGVRSALSDTLEKYPTVLNKIDNVQIRGKLAQIAEAPNVKAIPSLTFEETRELQKALGPEIAKMERQMLNGTVSRDEAKSLERLYGAIHGDLKRWGNHGSNQKAYKAYQEANEVYKKEILPFEQNDLVKRWKRGDYDSHNEKLLSDLTAPSMKTQQDKLLWYLSQADHDATGYVELVRRANRAAKALAKGAEEPSLPLGLATLIDPRMAVARAGGAGASGSPWVTPLVGASPNILPTRVMGGLAATGGLSWNDLQTARQ